MNIRTDSGLAYAGGERAKNEFPATKLYIEAG